MLRAPGLTENGFEFRIERWPVNQTSSVATHTFLAIYNPVHVKQMELRGIDDDEQKIYLLYCAKETISMMNKTRNIFSYDILLNYVFNKKGVDSKSLLETSYKLQ